MILEISTLGDDYMANFQPGLKYSYKFILIKEKSKPNVQNYVVFKWG